MALYVPHTNWRFSNAHNFMKKLVWHSFYCSIYHFERLEQTLRLHVFAGPGDKYCFYFYSDCADPCSRSGIIRTLLRVAYSNTFVTKGKTVKIDTADRCLEKRLEKRLEKTPSNARCFAQGFSLMCLSILESLMGTAHGAKELGLCPHGLACQAGA